MKRRQWLDTLIGMGVGALILLGMLLASTEAVVR